MDFQAKKVGSRNNVFHSNATHLVFNPGIAMTKPESIRNKNTKCPFCDRENLTGIIAEEGQLLLLRNKYPTLEGTFQTVLIETNECQSELSEYSKEHVENLFHFALYHWKQMRESGDFRSVILFKNHGPMSGGSLRHPHMQIVGLKHLDYREDVIPSQFEGIVLQQQNGVTFTLSTKPKVGFTEFNVLTEMGRHTEQVASYVQIATKFILSGYLPFCESYNIFFYEMENQMAVKIVPRYLTSPYFVGYTIPQVWTGLDDIVKHVQDTYLL